MKKSITAIVSIVFGSLFLSMACGKKSDDKTTSAQSYSFTSTANASITNSVSSASLELQATAGPTLCSSVVCVTPTSISGKYYGTGLLIQSNGNGMMAYFGQSEWSSITGTSTSYSFSSASPVVNAGNLVCCTGSGDLSSENTYIESVAYLFSYIDATFAISGVTGNTAMNTTYSLRFVLADDAISSGKRGDVLILDSGTYKWMDNNTSALSATRPTTPVTMNSSVTSWQNPFGSEKGNQTIPVIYANVAAPSSGGVFQVKESELKVQSKTYSFGFNKQNFIMFPTVLTNDINMISSVKELLSRVHLGGLPHSAQSMGVGNPASTQLTITQ